MTLSTCGFFQSSFFAGKNSLKIILKYYFYYNNIFKMSKCFLPYLIYMIHPLCVISFCSFFFSSSLFSTTSKFQIKNYIFVLYFGLHFTAFQIKRRRHGVEFFLDSDARSRPVFPVHKLKPRFDQKWP